MYSDNYQGFNTSIGSYRSVVHSVSTTQNNINEAKDLLSKARTDLSTRRPVLRELRSTSLKYKQMIEILEDIEKLNAVPDKLEQQISQKLFMSAYATLSDAITTSNQETLSQIPALQSIKSYLQSQEVALYSVLVEELHNHIYLKSPYTDSRWHSYRQGVDDFGTFEQLLEDKIIFDLSEKSSSFSETSQLDTFLADFNKNKPFVELQEENAESNSFYYIRLLIVTLGNLNKLPAAFEAVIQRLSNELHKMVDKTITEVTQRFPKNLNTQVSKSPYNLYEIGIHAGDNRLAALKDLTWTLYSKYIAVLQAHRVIYEVSQKFYSSQDKSGIPVYDFTGIFNVIEAEIRSLLNSYIADTSKTPFGKVNNNTNGSDSNSREAGISGSDSTSPSVNNRIESSLIRNKYTLEKSGPRNKNRPLFKFSNLDIDQQDVKEQYNQLQAAFEKTVPGLVAASRGETSSSDKFNPYLPLELTVSHQLLVPPNVFNIRVMLEPTVQFVQKASSIFPENTPKPGDEFIENFLVHTFVPHLEKTLVEVYKMVLTNNQANGAPLTEYSLHWNKLSKLPILEGIVKFYDYFRKTCYLLNTSSVYRENYADLILKGIDRFSKACATHFESKVSYQASSATDESKLINKHKVGAAWALDPSIRVLLENSEYDDSGTANSPSQGLSPVPSNNTNSPISAQPVSLSQKEINFYLNKRACQKAKNVVPITQNDLLSFTAFQQLAALATSLRWLCIKLRQMKRVVEEEPSSALSLSKSSKAAKSSSLSEVTNASDSDDTSSSSDISTRVRKRWLLMELLKPVEDVVTGIHGSAAAHYASMNGSSTSLTVDNSSNSVGTNGGVGSSDGTGISSSQANAIDSVVDSVGLALAGPAADRFELIISQMERLANTCVLTLKADLRCRSLYYIDRTMIEGKYYLAGDTEDRDLYVGKLDVDITKLDGIAVESMLPSDRHVLLAGLARFLDQALIAGADGLQYINDFGIKKMYRNIVVLQQMLKSVAESPQFVDFSRSLAFYKMVEMTTIGVLEQARRREQTPFSHDEIKTILRLIRSKAIRRFELLGRKDMVITERNAYHEDLVRLHNYYWGSEKVEVS